MVIINIKMLCYTYQDFKEIENKTTINELNQSSINVINAISKKVGAPTYRKTPVFRKKKQDISNGSFKKTKLHNAFAVLLKIKLP